MKYRLLALTIVLFGCDGPKPVAFDRNVAEQSVQKGVDPLASEIPCNEPLLLDINAERTAADLPIIRCSQTLAENISHLKQRENGDAIFSPGTDPRLNGYWVYLKQNVGNIKDAIAEDPDFRLIIGSPNVQYAAFADGKFAALGTKFHKAPLVVTFPESSVPLSEDDLVSVHAGRHVSLASGFEVAIEFRRFVFLSPEFAQSFAPKVLRRHVGALVFAAPPKLSSAPTRWALEIEGAIDGKEFRHMEWYWRQ
jgi:hypothetical protein